MDKILSYPIEISRSRRSGRILLGPRIHSPDKARWMAPTESPWAQVTGPISTLTGQAQVSGANLSDGLAIWPNSCRLETISKLHRFLNKTTPFSQNEIARFSNIR